MLRSENMFKNRVDRIGGNWIGRKTNKVLFVEVSFYVWTVDIKICCAVTQSCPTLRNFMDCDMPGFPVLHCLLEFAQIHVHWIGDAIHHPLLSHFPPIFSLSQHQGFFQRVNSLHQVAKVLKFQLHHQSFQRTGDQDWSPLGWTGWISILTIPMRCGFAMEGLPWWFRG